MVVLTVHAATNVGSERFGPDGTPGNVDDLVAAGQIDENNTALITYTLKGAAFAESVSPSDIRAMDFPTGDGTAALTTRITDGGRRGNTSVTVEVGIIDGDLPGDDDIGRNYDPAGSQLVPKIVFDLPMLQVTGAVLDTSDTTGLPIAIGVSVIASIEPERAGSNPFPRSIQGADADVEHDDSASDNYVGSRADEIGLEQSQVVNTMDSAFKFAWAGGPPVDGVVVSDTAQVDVEDRKSIIALNATTTDPSVADRSQAGPALLVGTISIVEGDGSNIRDLGGMADAIAGTDAKPEVGSGLSGDVDVTVGGPFQTGDRIFLGTNEMEVDDGGLATASVDIESLLQTNGGLGVRYVPGGVEDLTPGAFGAQATLDFDQSKNVSGKRAQAEIGLPIPVASLGLIQYDGFTPQGYAYGVARANGSDRSFVRMTCGEPGGCLVFLDCTDQGGMDYFGEYGRIQNGETAVVNSDGIADVLGGGWESGRGRCDLVSSGDLEVQHMVSRGTSLINNSVVINRPID